MRIYVVTEGQNDWAPTYWVSAAKAEAYITRRPVRMLHKLNAESGECGIWETDDGLFARERVRLSWVDTND